MLHIINIIKEYVYPFVEGHPIVYFIILFLTSMIGGFDDKLSTLIIVALVTIVAKALYRKKIEYLNIIKIYLIICLGNILDIGFKLTSSLREYLILYYTYNTFVDAVNLFTSDKKLKFPKQIKKQIDKNKKE